MPVAKRRRRRLDQQLSLIDPPLDVPQWHDIPQDMRERAQRLLGTLVLQHAVRAEAGRGKGIAGE
jgi:hypothetical protein